MLRNQSEIFLFAMIIIFAVPFLFWKFAKTDSYAPLVVVQIISGIFLGPAIMGNIVPGFYNAIFTSDTINILNGIAWWGVILFVWTAGLELDLSSVMKSKKETAITAASVLITPLIACSALAYMLMNVDGLVGDNAMPWQFILGIGMAGAVTALPILILLMEKINILRSDLGKRILRYASLDDILIWTVLAIIIMDWERVLRQIIFIPLFVIASYALRKNIRRIKSKHDFWIVSILWVLAISLSADWSGLHFMVGAFLSGAVMDKEWFGKPLEEFRNSVLLLLMPVFFLITGLKTEWSMSAYPIFGIALALLIAQIFGKILGSFIAGKILKWEKRDFYKIGWLLQTKALIEIIFCTILLDKNIITNEMFTALLLMAISSTMLTMPMVNRQLTKK